MIYRIVKNIWGPKLSQLDYLVNIHGKNFCKNFLIKQVQFKEIMKPHTYSAESAKGKIDDLYGFMFQQRYIHIMTSWYTCWLHNEVMKYKQVEDLYNIPPTQTHPCKYTRGFRIASCWTWSVIHQIIIYHGFPHWNVRYITVKLNG